LLTDLVGAVAPLLEQMRVRVESHTGARVTEAAADLNDIEADVDDQMTGEGVAQIVDESAAQSAADATLALGC